MVVGPLLQIFVDRTLPRKFGSRPAVGWRLVAANGREVGRSRRVFAAADDAVADFCRVAAHGRVGTLRPAVLNGGAEDGWRWMLSIDTTEVARSHRAYSRRRECLSPLELFLALLVSAPEDPEVVLLPELPRPRPARPCSPPPRPTAIVDTRSGRLDKLARARLVQPVAIRSASLAAGAPVEESAPPAPTAAPGNAVQDDVRYAGRARMDPRTTRPDPAGVSFVRRSPTAHMPVV